MRILHLIYTLGAGGAQKMMALLCNSQAAQGHVVTAMQLTGPATPGSDFHVRMLDPAVRHFSAHMDHGPSLKGVWEVCREIHRFKPDVVHVHSNAFVYLWPMWLARFLTRITREVPVVWTMHSIHPGITGPRWQRPFNRLLFRSRRLLPVGLSPSAAKIIHGIYGQWPEVVVNGLPPVSPTPEFDAVRKRIEALKPSPDVPVFLHASRFSRAKNPRRLIDAFRRLDGEGVDYLLIVIGDRWDSEEAMQLRRQSPRGARFLGHVGNPGDYILLSDAFCLSSDVEGIPLTVIEALSCGVTPVCTPAGGIPEMVADGETAYLSDGMSAEGLAGAIRRFLRHPLPVERLKQAYRQKFTLEVCVDKYMAIYREALR